MLVVLTVSMMTKAIIEIIIAMEVGARKIRDATLL